MSNHTGTTAKLVCTPFCQFVVECFVGEALYTVLTYLISIFKNIQDENLIKFDNSAKSD
jgi:hypothetical protein